ncbi:hypothetical protein ACFQ6Q_22155, partial [Streptomyces sp. NPDC056437]
CEPAKAELLGGGDFVIWGGQRPGHHLAGSCTDRHRRARKWGTETRALSATADMLTQYGTAPL